MRIKKPVVSHKNLSRKLPWQLSISWVLVIKTFNLLSTTAGAIIVGALSLALLILWGLIIFDFLKYDEEPVDIFKSNEPIKQDEKSNRLRRNRRQPLDIDEADEFR